MSDENSPVVTFQRRRKVRRALLDANVRECSEVETRASPLPWCPLVSPLVPNPTHNFVTATRQPAQGRPNLAKSTEHAKAKDSKPNQANVKTAKTVDLTSDSSTLPAGNTTATGSGRQQPPGAWRKTKKKQASQREQAQYAHHISTLKEQFAEVDAFELIAETPSPAGPGPRGTSSMLSLDKRERSALKSERSESMLGRMSHGLQDALVWLNKSVLKSGGGKKNRLDRPSMDRVGVALDFGADKAAIEEIFTIGEEGEEAEEAEGHGGPDGQVAEPTPSTDEPAENLDLTRLHLGDGESLRQLLRLCGQEDSSSKIPTMEALLKRLLPILGSASTSKRTFGAKKVGEGAFGEVFRTDQDIVFKIVPIETLSSQKTAAEILSEAEVGLKLTKLRQATEKKSITDISNVTSGFVETHAVGVCRGAYAQQLVVEWNRWNELHRSENDPVDRYGASQMYAIFVQSNGGIDLESFKPRNFDEVKSILLQVALTLAVAENACQFEHRDLHWGNVLVKREGPAGSSSRLECTMNDVDISVDTCGVVVALIDFTLSRLAKGSDSTNVVFCDLSADPEIFNGPEGDLQADAYRRMRDTVFQQNGASSPWERHVPETNAIWLEYLAGIMLHHKGKWKAAEKEALEGFMRRAREEGECAESLVWDQLFAGSWE